MASVSPQSSVTGFSEIIFHPRDESDAIVIPPSAATLDGFRNWALSDKYPERGRLSFLNGELHIEMTPERIDTHNFIKTEISVVLSLIIKDKKLGYFFSDRTLLSNATAVVSTEPDAMFVSRNSLRSGKAEFSPNKNAPQELSGTPDWVLEIVSPSSKRKDTQLLRDAYYRAGIGEYWLVDALGDTIDFQILVPGEQAYKSISAQEGWLTSPAFGKKFRLERAIDEDGLPDYTLHVS